jgi:hypothetical protein
MRSISSAKLSAWRSRLAASRLIRMRTGDALQWITVGGGEAGGKKHVGGTPVLIDAKGVIQGGPKSLRGRSLKSLDRNVAGAKKDRRGKPTLSKDDRSSIKRRFDAGEHVGEIARDHGIDERRVRRIAERTPARTPERQMANLRTIAREVAGRDKEDQDGFIELVKDLHRERVQGIEEFNQQMRDFSGKNIYAKRIRAKVQLTKARGGDVDQIPGFDLVVDHARRHYPALLHVPGEPGHDEESALMENIARGMRPVPPLDDDDIVAEAVSYARSYQSRSKPSNVDEHDYIPFSLLALRRRIAADAKRLFAGRLNRRDMMRFSAWAERQTFSRAPVFARLSASCSPTDRFRLAVALELIRFAAARAPKGGVSIGGKFYKGGKFIPGKTQAEVNTAAKRQGGQKNLFDDEGEAVGKPASTPVAEPSVGPSSSRKPQETQTDVAAAEFTNAATGRKARAIHAMLDRPEIMDEQSVALAFSMVDHAQMDRLAVAIASARPDLAEAVDHQRSKYGPAPATSPPAASETPREAAARETKRLIDEQYVYARKSSIPNAGEDLLGSARHRVNAWRGLAEAEKEGTASEFVTRSQLEKNEPHNLLATVDAHPHNALSALTLHFAMKSFPPKPGYGNRYRPDPEQAKKDRKQYYDAYGRLKSKAESLAISESDPQKALSAFRAEVLDLIKELRGQQGNSYMDTVTAPDPYNATANSLIGLANATKASSYGGPKKNSAMGRLMEFSAALKDSGFEIKKENWEELTSRVKDVIEFDSISKAFGKKGAAKKGFTPSELYVQHASRKGGRKLGAKTANAAVKSLVEGMGMRGVQWGNSVTDDEREHHAVKAAEAMMDLADVLGLDDTHMSLGGNLGFAIGARGKGTALAHYEPSTKVINLTRKGGVGSLAHEWGHFFDHAMANFGISADHSRGRSDADYHSERYSPERIIRNEDGKGYKVENGKLVTENLSNDPMWKGFDGVRKAFRGSGFERRLHDVANQMVRQGVLSKSKRNYWVSTREVFARSFERYVQHKLKVQGRENTYLSGVTSHPLWPTDDEVAQMAPAFDALFEAYKSQRQHRKAGMSRPRRRRSRMAVAHAPKGGVSVDGKFYPGGKFIPGKSQAEVDAAAARSKQKSFDFGDDDANQAAAKDRLAAAIRKKKESLAAASPEAKIADWKRNGVRSQAFKAWFGDWQQDPDNASKVVNPETGEPQETHGIDGKASKVVRDGKPVVVYHGTAKGGFEAFDKAKISNDNLYGPGFYFTEDRTVADEYRAKGAEQRYSLDLPRQAAERMAAIMEKNGWTDRFAGGFYDDLQSALKQNDSRWTLEHAANWLAGQAGKGDEEANELILAAGLELMDNRSKAETKAVYLNIREPFDIDGAQGSDRRMADLQSIEDAAERILGEPGRLGAMLFPEQDLDVKDPESGATLRQYVQSSAATMKRQLQDTVWGAFSNDVLYANLTRLGNRQKAFANAVLQEAGYDGITHVGGRIVGDREHRVWIAFEPKQIKAVDNRGTFDPQDDRIRMSRLAWTRRVQWSLARLSAADWTRYKGPRGGKGWKNGKTGRVIYGEKPGGKAKKNAKPARGSPTTSKAKIAKQKERLKRELRRAPAGGAWVGEKFYRGGQIVSKSVEFTAYGKDKGAQPAVTAPVTGKAKKPRKNAEAKAKGVTNPVTAKPKSVTKPATAKRYPQSRKPKLEPKSSYVRIADRDAPPESELQHMRRSLEAKAKANPSLTQAGILASGKRKKQWYAPDFEAAMQAHAPVAEQRILKISAAAENAANEHGMTLAELRQLDAKREEADQRWTELAEQKSKLRRQLESLPSGSPQAQKIEKEMYELGQRIADQWDIVTPIHHRTLQVKRRIAKEVLKTLRPRNAINRYYVQFPTQPPPERADRAAPLDDPQQQKLVDGVMTELAALVSDKHFPRVDFYQAAGSQAHRSYHANGDVFLAKHASEDTIWHEVGHAIELNSAKTHELILGFIGKRVGDQTPLAMQELFPGWSFSADEFGRDDRFWRLREILQADADVWYIGKDYVGNSEILSMGMEMLRRDPLRFAEIDPEYFHLVTGILDGSLL